MAPSSQLAAISESEPKGFSGFFNRLSFGWINGVVSQSRKGKLTEDRLPQPADQRADVNFELFQEQWAQELKKDPSSKDPPSLFKALWRIYGREIMIGGIFKMAWSVFVIMGAFFFVRSLLGYVDPTLQSPFDSDFAGWMLVVFFFIDAWLLGLSLQRMGDYCLRVGIKIRAALVSSVAKKSLSMESVKKELSADIVGFIASDINKVYDGIQQIHYLWTAPIEACTILSLLTSLTKLYAVPGWAVVFVVLGLQYWFGYLIIKYKYANAHNAANRVALAQEVLPSMKIVKYYGWEKFFIQELNQIRNDEQPTLWKLIIIRATSIAMVFTTPPLTAFTIFTAYEFAVGKLTSDLAFTTLSLFNIMRFPLVVLPKAIRSASEGWSSMGRIQEFLLLPLEHRETAFTKAEAIGISINNAEFVYKESKDGFVLQVPKFEVKAGEVVGIAGRVGSGKTSVINAIMGHNVLRSGTAHSNGSMAYVRQMAWLQNIACRDNILFGEQYDEKKYNDVVYAAALELDFQILANGDNTPAGLRGINLSGGQRQRINIARAAYSDADIMLLDSPLSAVDHHTAHHIFSKCIKKLFMHKAVVLVTHSIDLLPKCDKMAIMDEGKMVYFGPFSMAAVNKFMPSGANSLLEDESKAPEKKAVEGPRKSIERPPPKDARHMEHIVIPGEAASCQTGYRYSMLVSMQKYWIEGGLLIGILSVFWYAIAQATRQMSDYWIRQWVNDTLAKYPNAESQEASLFYSMIYMALMLTFGALNWMRGFTYFIWTRKAANSMFQKYVSRTFGAPLAFFLNNPVGDLINVYAKDQDIVDENLPEALHYTGIYGLIMLATVVTVSMVIPMFSIFAGILIIVSAFMLTMYLPPATQLKVLTAESNGALTGLISEALEGLDVIQAYKKQAYFIQESEQRCNAYHRYFFNSEALNLWLAFYCDFFGAVLVGAVATFSVVQKEQLGAANVGLAFSNVIQMLVFYTWVIRFLADTISFWGSTERIAGLALNTPSESDLAPPPTKEGALVLAPDNWKPKSGRVKFDNVWMRYKHTLPWALRGVTFDIAPHEKIGVVGRTGSGKSTLLLALYRMFELGAGRVVYDDMDIACLPRDKLRRSLSIIPQEPLMFSGTLRVNLDPFAEHAEAELWEALHKVGLKEHSESMAGGLDAYVDGTTSEWSLGQKQLLCLARAALTRVPVLCLDEATAAMDPQTEFLVLQTIDELFEDRTIFSIAHRLDVVIKGTRILVMEQGENMEIDTPDNLLSRADSMFSMLVDRSGPIQAAALRHLAREEAIKRGLRAP